LQYYGNAELVQVISIEQKEPRKYKEKRVGKTAIFALWYGMKVCSPSRSTMHKLLRLCDYSTQSRPEALPMPVLAYL